MQSEYRSQAIRFMAREKWIILGILILLNISWLTTSAWTLTDYHRLVGSLWSFSTFYNLTLTFRWWLLSLPFGWFGHLRFCDWYHQRMSSNPNRTTIRSSYQITGPSSKSLIERLGRFILYYNIIFAAMKYKQKTMKQRMHDL